MAWNKNRARPTACYLEMPSGCGGAGAVTAGLNRTVLLRTGRGDVRLDPEEAEALAEELIKSAAESGKARKKSTRPEPE